MNWTLRKKILLGYGAVLLLLILVFGWAFVNLLRLGQASEAILSENYRSIRAADHMIAALERQDSGVLLYILGFEEEGFRQYRTNQADFLQWLGRAKDNITIEGEAEIVSRLDSSYRAYLIAFTRLLRDSSADAEMRYHEALLPALVRVRRAGDALRDLNRRTMVAVSDRAEEVARRAMWSMGLVGLAALGLGLALSLVLSNRLVRPLRKLQEATRRVAGGDYDVAVPARTSDELGRLAGQFNEMTGRLRAFRDLNVEQIMAEKRKSDAIIHSIDDGLVVVNARLDISNMNPAAEEILDVSLEHAQGRHVLEVIRDDRLFAGVRAAAQPGHAPEVEEADRFFSVERQGTVRHYQSAVTPVYTPSGERIGVILLLRDVTKLKELDRLKSEFVATASHELKTPLTSIGMSIGLLEEHLAETLDARDAELLAVAQEDVERLRTLVLDLLDLSKIEAGRIELDIEAAPVSLLAEKAVQTLQGQALQREIDLRSEVPGDLPAVRADANKITWVLTNLISNALRHTDPGGHIRLSAEAMGEHVHVSVEDDGEGIPKTYQAKIFDKFVQVDGEKIAGGSGLGLAICREIVRAHGGSIWVDSAPGEGSTFTFSLRVA